MKDLHLQRLKTPSLLASGNPGAFLSWQLYLGWAKEKASVFYEGYPVIEN